MESLQNEIARKRAGERVYEIKTFYIMTSGYILLMPFLVFLNFKITPEIKWFWFPVLGGAVSIAGYAFYLFAAKKWEHKKIQQFMDKEKTSEAL